jgi:DNA-binding CsgD family transcriptional regulator
MKKPNALAYIRQLCCLGLGKEVMIPELLRAVQAVVPSSGNTFVGLGEKFIPAYGITEFVIPEVISLLVKEGPRMRAQEMTDNLMRWHGQNPNRVLDNPDIMCDRFYRSEYYHHIWRPYDTHHFLQGLVRQPDRPEGLFFICRPRSQRPFNAVEKDQFARLLPHVAHGLKARSGADADYADRGESGLFIVDGQGKLVFASAVARKLLSLIHYPIYPITPGSLIRDIAIPPALSQLCRNLDGIFRGRDAPPPTLTHTNPRGRFVFRAHWLDSVNPGPGGMIGVTVEHQEPVALRLWRGLKDLPLSPAQMEVCLLLARNHTQESIARRLNIKPTTVKDHVRKIYDKLGICRREELTGRLTASAEIFR